MSMSKMTRRRWLTNAAATTAALGAAGLSSTAGQEATPKDKQRYNFIDVSPREQIQRRHLPNLPLITQDNKSVRFYDDLVKDKRVVIQFMFARCKDICPVITHHLVEVQQKLNGRVGRDIFFYSITLSPEEDKPRNLKAFAKRHGVGPGWTFLTGKPEDIMQLRTALGFTYKDPKEDADRNNHTGMILVGTEPLTRWAHCQGGADPDWIATVIRTEADAPLIGEVDGLKQQDVAVSLKSPPAATSSQSPSKHRHGQMRQ
jgi:protein SCO1/2